MTEQLARTVALTILLGACGVADTPTDDAGAMDDAGTTDDGGRAVDAGSGVCCPVTTAPGCTGGTDEAAGGWAASAAACTATISGPFQEQIESHGCTALVRRTNFGECGPLDAGP